MAKLKVSNAKRARNDRYKSESRAQKNRDMKLKRHIAKNAKAKAKAEAKDKPEIALDKVAINALKKPKGAKQRASGKNMTKANREKFYVDAAGHEVGAPSFMPEMKKNPRTGRMEIDRTVGADWMKATQGLCK